MDRWMAGLPRSTKFIFTDVSKASDESEPGRFIQKNRWCTLYRTFHGFYGSRRRVETQSEDVLTCLDNIVMIKALMSPVTISMLVKRCIDYLNFGSE